MDDVKVRLEQCQDKLDELRQSGDDTRNAEQQASMEMKQVEHELRHVLEQVAVAGQEKSGFTERDQRAGYGSDRRCEEAGAA